MKKKLVALMLSTLMALSVFVGCGEKDTVDVDTQKSEDVSESEASEAEEPKEPVEIVYWYCNGVGTQEYTDEVEAKINELLAETEGYEHITLKLHPSKDYATDIALAQASGEQMDVISVTFELDWTTEAANGAILALDDLLAANSEIAEDLPEWFLGYGVMDGATYMIPNYQQCANQYFFAMPTEWFEQSGYDYDEVQAALWEKDVEYIAKFMEDYTLAVREYTGKETKYTFPSVLSHPYTWIQQSNRVYTITSGEGFYYNTETGKIECTYLNENEQNAWRKEAELVSKGINYPNQQVQSLTEDVLGDIFNDESYVMYRVQGMGTTEMEAEKLKNTYGYDVTLFEFDDYFYIPETNAAGGVAISATTEHPEEAAKVLALLFNSKYEEIYNTLVYGLEGIHYKSNGDGTIETLEFSGTQGGADTTYCYHKWRGGNTFNAWLNQSMTQEQETFIIDVINEGENNVISPIMGITLDCSNIENELAQIKALHSEYVSSFRCGVYGDDVDNYIDEFERKLETAGIQKVLDELNAQVDAFLGR